MKLGVARGSEVYSVTPHTQTLSSPACVQPVVINEALGTASQLCNYAIICRGSAADCICPGAKRQRPHHWTALL